MTINERMRYIRKEILQFNQTQFAETIGMKQTSVSSMEKNGATVSEQAIKSTSAIHGISEVWIRTGKGPIKVPTVTFSLDKFVQEHGGTDLELKILKTYFELPNDLRHMLVEHFKNGLLDQPQPVSEHPIYKFAASKGLQDTPESRELTEKLADIIHKDVYTRLANGEKPSDIDSEYDDDNDK